MESLIWHDIISGSKMKEYKNKLSKFNYIDNWQAVIDYYKQEILSIIKKINQFDLNILCKLINSEKDIYKRFFLEKIYRIILFYKNSFIKWYVLNDIYLNRLFIIPKEIIIYPSLEDDTNKFSEEDYLKVSLKDNRIDLNIPLDKTIQVLTYKNEEDKYDIWTIEISINKKNKKEINKLKNSIKEVISKNNIGFQTNTSLFTNEYTFIIKTNINYIEYIIWTVLKDYLQNNFFFLNLEYEILEFLKYLYFFIKDENPETILGKVSSEIKRIEEIFKNFLKNYDELIEEEINKVVDIVFNEILDNTLNKKEILIDYLNFDDEKEWYKILVPENMNHDLFLKDIDLESKEHFKNILTDYILKISFLYLINNYINFNWNIKSFDLYKNPDYLLRDSLIIKTNNKEIMVLKIFTDLIN